MYLEVKYSLTLHFIPLRYQRKKEQWQSTTDTIHAN